LLTADDGLARLHAGAVLDGPGDADGDVELRRDGLAGLPHLEAVRVEAGVDGGPRGADGRAERVGQASMIAKFSALATPRPPETTIEASVSSGRLLFISTTLSTTRVCRACSESETATGTSSPAAGAGSGVTELPRSV
jgi:hypothetical protein